MAYPPPRAVFPSREHEEGSDLWCESTGSLASPPRQARARSRTPTLGSGALELWCVPPPSGELGANCDSRDRPLPGGATSRPPWYRASRRGGEVVDSLPLHLTKEEPLIRTYIPPPRGDGTPSGPTTAPNARSRYVRPTFDRKHPGWRAPGIGLAREAGRVKDLCEGAKGNAQALEAGPHSV